MMIKRTNNRGSGKSRRLLGRVVAPLIVLTMLFSLPLATSGAEAQDGVFSEAEQQDASRQTIQQLGNTKGPLRIQELDIDPALGPPPWISFVPDRDPSTIAAWNEIARRVAAETPLSARASLNANDLSQVVVQDSEAFGQRGLNDTAETGQLVAGFGTGGGDESFARIIGTLSQRASTRPGSGLECKSIEDDGAIPLSNSQGLEINEATVCEAVIGDGPFGTTSGDYDYYTVTANQGDFVTATIEAWRVGSDLDSYLQVWDDEGNELFFNDDTFQRDSQVRFRAPFTGDYHVGVSSWRSQPRDPFDSGSGRGVTSVGPYTLFLSRTTVAGTTGPDTDVYLVDLEAGDAISGGFRGLGAATIVDPSGRIGQGSGGSATFIYPIANPLRHFGDVGIDYVAEFSGIHVIRLESGEGSYEGELRVKRAGAADNSGDEAQILFLDFDGGSFNSAIFDPFQNPNAGTERTLSPLRDWLPRWGLDSSDEDAVIEAIVAEVTDDLLNDLYDSELNGNRDATGIGGELDLQILNSRDHEDPWGQPNVSRIIIGGSIPEADIFTIGIAQSIDPGNFDREETAIVLLDVLSGPSGGGASVNSYPLAEGFTKIDAVGRAVGNITAHEAGHFIGNWHTDSINGVRSIMDEGGNFASTFGVGNDGTFGTADDNDVNFVIDQYSFFEGFFGFESTTARSAFAFNTGQTSPGLTFDGLPDDGSYVLQNVRSGQFLDADGNGSVNVSNIANADDVWEFTNIGADVFNLQNEAFGGYLDGDPDGTVDQSAAPFNDDRWQLVPTNAGSFLLFNLANEQYLRQIGDNVELSSTTCDYSDAIFGYAEVLLNNSCTTSNDRWILVSPDMPSPFIGERITLQNLATDRYLDTDADGDVDQSRNQRADDVWNVIDAGDGFVFLRSDTSGRYIDGDGPSKNVDTSRVPNSDDRWQIIDDPSGAVLMHVDSGSYLTAGGALSGFNVFTRPRVTDATVWAISIVSDDV